MPLNQSFIGRTLPPTAPYEARAFVRNVLDGWGERAYLDRQPFFRDYPRLLIYETGIHFIDTFRYLLGEVAHVHAHIKRLNPVIKGEQS